MLDRAAICSDPPGRVGAILSVLLLRKGWSSNGNVSDLSFGPVYKSLRMSFLTTGHRVWAPVNGAFHGDFMSRSKKRLKIKTVIHRARKYVQEGNKTEAIHTIVRDAHYTVAEAEKLAEFIGYFFEVESDRQIVSRWCDKHACRDFSAATSALKNRRMMDSLILMELSKCVQLLSARCRSTARCSTSFCMTSLSETPG